MISNKISINENRSVRSKGSRQVRYLREKSKPFKASSINNNSPKPNP